MRTKVLKTNLLLIVLSVVFLSSCSSVELRRKFIKTKSSDVLWANKKYYSFNYNNDSTNIDLYIFSGDRELTFGFEYLPIFPSFWDRIILRQDRVDISLEINETIENLNGFLTIKLNGKTISYRIKWYHTNRGSIDYKIEFYADLDYIYQMELIFNEFEVNNKKIKIPNLLLDKVNYIGYREFFAS